MRFITPILFEYYICTSLEFLSHFFIRDVKTYGSIRASLASKRKPIGNNDLWIAAHAEATALAIATNNEGEFQRLPGLKVQNWVSRAGV
jgi:predicted nucleic acid-binding protein